MKKRDMQKWINALRSGEYAQGRTHLQDGGNTFCCLGVACKIFIPEKYQIKEKCGRLTGAFPTSQFYAPTWLKYINNLFRDKTGKTLAQLNDTIFISTEEYTAGSPLTFDEIADMLQLVYIEGAL